MATSEVNVQELLTDALKDAYAYLNWIGWCDDEDLVFYEKKIAGNEKLRDKILIALKAAGVDPDEDENEIPF